ncbi:MAG TPA: glycosyltransferase family 4 protein [Coleofasciculaceae cyanobacterium]
MKLMQPLSSVNVLEANDSSLTTAETLKVLILGPSLNQQGGMASVEKLIVHRIGDGIEVRHISTHEDGSIFRRLWIFQLALRQFLAGLLKNEVDLIHVHVSEKGSVFRAAVWVLLARLFGKPVVMHAHGCEFHQFHETLPKFVRHVVNWVFQQCACFIALSQSWREYYITHCELSPNRVVAFANPVSLPEQIPNRQGAEVVHFVCLGRVGHRKGSFDLLQAFAELSPEQKQRAKLRLAGDGEVKEAQSLADKLGIAPYVECLGWLNSDQCGKLLAESDVFVLPSYNEGLPMAMLEAMSWGLPVISTPVGGIPEVVIPHENGLLVNPGNSQELVDAMQILIEDEDLRLNLGRAARDQVTPLDVEAYCSRLASVYREIK